MYGCMYVCMYSMYGWTNLLLLGREHTAAPADRSFSCAARPNKRAVASASSASRLRSSCASTRWRASEAMTAAAEVRTDYPLPEPFPKAEEFEFEIAPLAPFWLASRLHASANFAAADSDDVTGLPACVQGCQL